MRTSILLPLVVGILVVGPAAAYTLDGAFRPVHSHRTHHHRPNAARAVALVPAAAIPVAMPLPHPFGDGETDGLSRDPDDCVSHGCIDSGGG